MRRRPSDDFDRSCKEKEYSILSAAGFEPAEEGWWVKGSVLFNRDTALQIVHQDLHKSGDDVVP